MPVIEGPAGPGVGGQAGDIAGAIAFASQNSGALITAVRVLVGFFGALFSKKAPARVSLLGADPCPFCHGKGSL